MATSSEHRPDLTQIPMIDFSAWITADQPLPLRLNVARELVEACHNTGFVYINNHGLSESLLSEAFSWSKKFFSLSQQEKALAAHPPGSQIFRGYSCVGHETIPPHEEDKIEGVVDYNESYGMGSDANEEQPNVWIPDSTLPGFQSFVKVFYAECWKTSQLVLRALALGLGLEDETALLKHHHERENEVSFRHYPPVGESKIQSGEMDRLGAHTDFDSFTLLFQDSLGGLKVKHPITKTWIDAPPIEGALIMNIGDVLSRWSNDYLVSTVHRVHLPASENSYSTDGEDGGERRTKDRYSIPYFVAPKAETPLDSLDVCCTEEKPNKYKSLVFSDLYAEKVAGYFAKKE